MDKTLQERSNGICELCSTSTDLRNFVVSPRTEEIAVCSNCIDQLEERKDMDPNHWRCLNDAMWSEVDAVKVVSYRILNKLSELGWPKDLLEMMYLEEDVLSWAKEGIESDSIIHLDSNGVQLNTGDSVVLIKDLNVKGGGFTAKRGTAVRNIRLVHDNEEQIEGKVEGQKIVILTKYVKK